TKRKRAHRSALDEGGGRSARAPLSTLQDRQHHLRNAFSRALKRRSARNFLKPAASSNCSVTGNGTISLASANNSASLSSRTRSFSVVTRIRSSRFASATTASISPTEKR